MRRRLSFIPAAIFTLFFLLLNAYVFSGWQALFPQPFFTAMFWALVGLINIGALIAVFRVQTHEPDRFFSIALHALISLFTSSLVFALVLLVTDVYRLLKFLLGFSATERPIFMVTIGAFLSIFLLLAFIYGIIWGKYAYRVIKHTLYFDDLPDAFKGFTIAQISDVHAGSFTNAQEVKKGIDLINQQQADVFVFTGDLVNNRASEIEPYIHLFSQIKAPYGQFSILGNHDYGDYVKWESDAAKQENLAQLKKYHQQLSFRLLLDEHVVLEKDGQKVVLLGIENWGLGFGERGDLQKALQNTTPNDFKILLSHDPSHWEQQVKIHPSKIHLTLSGHTHGMQFGIEMFGFKWSPVKWRYKHWAGIKQENNRIININRGFGFIGLSGRVGIWPEITVIELQKK